MSKTGDLPLPLPLGTQASTPRWGHPVALDLGRGGLSPALPGPRGGVGHLFSAQRQCWSWLPPHWAPIASVHVGCRGALGADALLICEASPGPLSLESGFPSGSLGVSRPHVFQPLRLQEANGRPGGSRPHCPRVGGSLFHCLLCAFPACSACDAFDPAEEEQALRGDAGPVPSWVSSGEATGIAAEEAAEGSGHCPLSCGLRGALRPATYTLVPRGQLSPGA